MSQVSQFPFSFDSLFSKKGNIKIVFLGTTQSYTQPPNKVAMILSGAIKHTNLVADTIEARQADQPTGTEWAYWADKVLAADLTGTYPIFQKGWEIVILGKGCTLYFTGDLGCEIALYEVDVS